MRRLVFLLVIAFAIHIAPNGAYGQPAAQAPTPAADAALDLMTQLQNVLAGVAERVFPSVVGVTSYVRDDSAHAAAKRDDTPTAEWQNTGEEDLYPGYRKLRFGSGVVISDSGQVVSLRQFVTTPEGALADLVAIETQDGRHNLGRIVGVEPTLNLAVLEFVPLSQRYPPKFVPATIGDSDSMRVGYWGIALGDPSGPEKAFSWGLMSALPERRCYQDDMGATYMVVSSPKVHPEAYGGPLVNIRGEVVGIMTPRLVESAVYSGFEYALPINIVLPVYNGISVEKSTRSPWLGISVLEMVALRKPERFRSLTRPRVGVYIDNVFDPSPAASAGLRIGDFVVRLNGKVLSSVFGFQEQLYLAGIGRRASLEVFRNGEVLHLEVTVEERPEAARPH